MDIDLTPLDEGEDEVLEETPLPDQATSAQSGKPVVIAAEGLTKHFTTSKGEVVKAVDGVSFAFTEQQFITSMGPSGSGKSTLLYLMGGLDRPTGGELLVDGEDLAHVSEGQEHHFRREKLGFVFQSFHLLSNLTALENVMLPMQLAGGQSTAQMRERARMLLLDVGISEDRHDHKPGKLAGGQQQRVAIARALANDPKVILADEPTGNLDVHNGARIIRLLKRLAEQGRTVIVVTHDRSIIRLADVRLEMADGKLGAMPKFYGATDLPTKTIVKSADYWEGKPATIVAEGLSKHFKHIGSKVVKAVDEASFTFAEEQFVTITGPSGSGKSTLLYLLGGLDKATRGSLWVDGVDLNRLSGRRENRFRRRSLGFVFQSFYLLPHLTALENVMMPMLLAGGQSQEQMRERARNLLFQVGINDERHNFKPNKLSGGQQQRVAIARALANDPKVILADEPTGNLDSHNGKRIVELLKALAEQGKTVIVVTHDRSIAKEADVRLEMADGRVRGTGNAAAPARPVAVSHKKKGKKRA
ncbi:MAG TPA: ABC transporter ATP-binding protein [Ktedonobacteraceae bacterium]